MNRQGSTPERISYTLLATRYLALQELREKVRQAEERFVSMRLKKLSIMGPASAMETNAPQKDQRSWPAGSTVR